MGAALISDQFSHMPTNSDTIISSVHAVSFYPVVAKIKEVHSRLCLSDSK